MRQAPILVTGATGYIDGRLVSRLLASSQGDAAPVTLTVQEGMTIERRRRVVTADAHAVFQAFAGLGGERGWLYMNRAWELRGFFDKLIGGVGLRRGRDCLSPHPGIYCGYTTPHSWTSVRMTAFDFPVGYEAFHRRQLFNYQLNRWYSLGYARREDMIAAGRRISSFADWKREMLRQAEQADMEGRTVNAAFYIRAAEFYARSDDPDKLALYHRFRERFDILFGKDGMERHDVPYDGSFLPAIHLPADGESKGTIVLHGGFDSFIEEFHSMMCFFARSGYDVVGFDGPGQGGALRLGGLPLTIEWERPVAAVCGHFRLEEATLIGLSMGGWLCLRAAAFEPRIARVIADGHALDYMKSMPEAMRALHLWCMRHMRGFMNTMARWKFELREGMAPWMVDQLKYITQRPEPLDALEIYLDLNEENMHPERIRQDILVLSSSADHFIPVKMHEMQMKALVNARSVSGRVFTEREQAHNHCQIGNIALALETMANWIERLPAREN